MAAFDYSTMWEAFVGGEWGAGSPGALTDAGMESGAYAGRVQQFYTDIVGPAFGYLGGEGVGFGEAFADRLGVGEERNVLEDAEREFRLAIGDPYYGADDPFAWETLSRYATGDTALTEAQKLLKGELYEKGGLLGGETGSAYGLSMEEQEEAYTSGMKGQREGLSYGALTSGVGLASGTSGAVLRSGQAIEQAEDVLSEAYKTSRGLGEAYTLGKEKTEGELRTDLDAAFKTYTDIIRQEKEGFRDNILRDVALIERAVQQEGSTAFADVSFGDPEMIKDFDEYAWSGLTYEEQLAADPTGAFELREDGACGIGELYNPDTGLCEVDPDLGMARNIYGELLGTGEGIADLYDCEGVFGGTKVIDTCGECGGNGETEVCRDGTKACPGRCPDCEAGYEEGPDGDCVPIEEDQQCPQGQIKNDSGNCIPDPGLECGGTGEPSYVCWDGFLACSAEDCAEEPVDDECGVPNGDNSTCADECGVPNGDNSTCADECGVPNGLGPEFECDPLGGGDIVCDESDCPDIAEDPDDEKYIECEETYGEGYSWNPVLEQCVWDDFDTGSCHQPYNTCDPGTCCGDNGICTSEACDDDEEEVVCDPATEVMDHFIGECVPIEEDDGDGCPSGQVWAPNGVDCVDPWDPTNTYESLECPGGTRAPVGPFSNPLQYCATYDPGGDDPWTQGIEGCTDSGAHNYNPEATNDDGS